MIILFKGIRRFIVDKRAEFCDHACFFGVAEPKDWMLPKSLAGVESRLEKRSFPMT
jgi:hypothetical protein